MLRIKGLEVGNGYNATFGNRVDMSVDRVDVGNSLVLRSIDG